MTITLNFVCWITFLHELHNFRSVFIIEGIFFNYLSTIMYSHTLTHMWKFRNKCVDVLGILYLYRVIDAARIFFPNNLTILLQIAVSVNYNNNTIADQLCDAVKVATVKQ